MKILPPRRPRIWTLAIVATLAAGTRAAADIDSLRLSYDVYVNGQGWIRDVVNGDIAGSPDRDSTLSAIRIRLFALSGEVNPGYSVCYEVFLKNGAWTGEVCDGALSGRAGGAEITTLRVRLKSPPGGLGTVCYATHRLSKGWDEVACNGAPSGLAAEDDPAATPLTALYGWVFMASEARGYHARSVWELTSTQRGQLASALQTCITMAIVETHHNIDHQGEQFFRGHRAMLRDEMEPCLRRQPGSANFLPLPFWNPGELIPIELRGVKKLDGPHPADPVLSPHIGRLRSRSPDARSLSGAQPYGVVGSGVCDISSGDDLFHAVHVWHSTVHYMVGGNFGDIQFYAPTALAFWPWHAYLDNIYALWRLCGPR